MSRPIAKDTLRDASDAIQGVGRQRPHGFVFWLRRLRAYPQIWIGGGVLFLLVFAAIAAPLIAPFDPTEVGAGPGFAQPSLDHLFGTDRLGRDIFSRMIYGGRIDLFVSITAVASSMLLGLLFGLLAGYRSGWLDTIIMRTMDGLLAFPGLVLALTIGFALGASTQSIITALAIVRIPAFARLTRAQMLSLRGQEFIVAAESIGVSPMRLVLRHFLPNLFAIILVEATLGAGATIFAAASLSFLGLGVPPPAPTWGGMLRDGYIYLETSPWLALIPGAFIFLAVLSFNFMGDGIRDVLDPQQRRRRGI